MENLRIAGATDTFFTPNVDFNETTGKCSISGESYLENTVEFYNELHSWLKAYFETKRPIDFHFSLTYFNTSSSKALLHLMNALKSYDETGGSVTVTWHYVSDDGDMKEEAEDFKLDSGLDLIILGDLVK